MDPISTIPGPVNAGAFVDGSSTASGAATLAEIAQLINKTNEVIGGLTTVAGDLDAAETAITAETAAREAADTDLAADITYLTTGFSDHASLIQDLESRVSDLEYATASGYVEVSSGDKAIANSTEKTINFTGTGGLQSLTLTSPMTDFAVGQSWTVVCNNADGVQISSANWAHSALVSGSVSNLYNLILGDMAIVSVVDFAGTKKWSATIIAGRNGYRTSAAGAGDLGSVDQDDRTIWVDRTGDTGTRDLYLPDLGAPTSFTNLLREITVILYGAESSGTFVVHVAPASSDTFLDGATTYTMTERSACRFIGGPNNRWAAIAGGGM